MRSTNMNKFDLYLENRFDAYYTEMKMRKIFINK